MKSGVELTKANTGLPDTVSRRWSVWGLAPDGTRSRVTTPLTPVDVVELPVELVPLPVELTPRPLDPPPLAPDEVGRGDGVGVRAGSWAWASAWSSAWSRVTATEKASSCW